MKTATGKGIKEKEKKERKKECLEEKGKENGGRKIAKQRSGIHMDTPMIHDMCLYLQGIAQ